ncbi:MAG: hypothetical protein MZU79_06970 [Anaerotruncus sp.]|nr:hypothetical protein [Anaerotruncus sp.]
MSRQECERGGQRDEDCQPARDRRGPRQRVVRVLSRVPRGSASTVRAVPPTRRPAGRLIVELWTSGTARPATAQNPGHAYSEHRGRGR